MRSDPTDAVWHPGNLEEPHAVEDKARRVRAMFDAVARTYERVNTICSLGRDAHWRRRAVRLAHVGPADRVLDVACGTGDLARAFAAHKPAPRGVVGADFSHEMIRLAPGASDPAIRWCEADALSLPFEVGTFQVVSCAFGIRNFSSLSKGLTEMYRVLDDGGRVVILEFSDVKKPVIRQLYQFYFNILMPRIAAWLSSDSSGAYRYLPRSVLRFADRRQIVRELEVAGFTDVRVDPLSLGIAIIYVATKDPRPAGIK